MLKVKTIFLKFFIIILIASALIFIFSSARASSLVQVSDMISTSKPGAESNHIIKFKTPQDVPPNGKINILFQENAFELPIGLDFTDFDLKIATSANSEYLDRILSAVADADNDGIQATTSISGKITITLNSSTGLNAGDFIKILIGSNANYQDIGDNKIINPLNSGSYKIFINTTDQSDNELDRSEIFIATVSQVALGVFMPKVRGNGQPSGVLLAGTTQSFLTLTTNYLADCRFSNASGTPYDLIPNTFTYTGGNYHSYLLTGLEGGRAYYYYVRCQEIGFDADTTDYEITFSIQTTGSGGSDQSDPTSGSGGGTEGQTGGYTGGGTKGGGGGGGGTGGGTGSTFGQGTGDKKPYPEPLTDPDLFLAGLAYPFSDVYVLKDSMIEKTVKANNKAEFNTEVGGLNEGVYTFGVKANDSDGIGSAINNITFWIKKGTKTNVSDIFLPPTISLNKYQVSQNESIKVFGQSVPLGKIEIWFYPDSIRTPSLLNVQKSEGEADAMGKWTVVVGTDGLDLGNYNIKARTTINSYRLSDFSKTLNCTIGEGGGESNCQRSDLNKDKKINLIDFSILLYNWGKTGPIGDINQDGKVNLVDFSLMMYCWTG